MGKGGVEAVGGRGGNVRVLGGGGRDGKQPKKKRPFRRMDCWLVKRGALSQGFLTF